MNDGASATDREVVREALPPLPSGPEFARLLLEVAPAIVMVLDADGRIVHANRRLGEVSGLDTESLVGRDAFDTLLTQRYRRVARRIFGAALAGRPPRATILPILARDRDVREIRWRGTALSDVGEGHPGVLVVGEDVTETRRREARLDLTQFAVDHAADAAFWMTEDGRFFYVNDAACRVLGYTQDELLWMTVHDIDPNFPRDTWPEKWLAMRARGSAHIESQQRHKSGRLIPVEITANFVRFGRQHFNCAFVRDISDRKQAEEALRDSEERFRTVVGAMREAMIAIDENGDIHLFNPAAERIFGWPAAEVEGGSLDRLLPDAYRSRHASLVRRYFEGSTPGPAFSRMLELPGRHRDGHEIPLEISLTEARIGDRRFVIGVARDASQRVETMAALRESEERLELAIRGAGLGLWDWDIRAGTIRHNERWAEMLGYALEELDPSFATWEQLVHAEDYPGVHAALQAHLDGDTDVYEHEYRLQSKHGKWIWVHDRGRVLERDAKGAPIRAAGTHLDITERRLAQAELAKTQALLRAAVEQTPAGILIADAPDVRIRLANAAALGIRGETVHELTDIPVGLHPEAWQTLHPDGSPYDPEALPLSRAVLLGETVRNEEILIRRQSGEDRWVLANASPVHDESGNVVAGVVVFPDITERKRAYAEQHALELKVQEAQKYESLGVLAGGIAHDFNNLLTSVLGHADLATSKCSGASDLRGHLAGIATAATRAADLCRQLLAYSGRGRFIIENLDLQDLIREMGDLLEVSVAKGIRIEYGFGEDVPAVRADVTQLRQIVMNLITNASEAIGPRGGRIGVATHAKNWSEDDLHDLTRPDGMNPGSYVCLEVSDDGCGMDDATAARVFDPFFTTKFTGRGLGLAAVLGIVRSHGGGIDVTADPGRGTTFRILLPACAEDARSTPSPHGTEVAWRGEGTVLVVDDEDAVREVLGLFLEQAGFRVLSARDGVEAVEVYRERMGEIDAVVLDLTMPRMDGVEAYAALRRIRSDVPVLLTSGYTEEELATRFGDGLPAAFVQKPCRARDLIRGVRIALQA